jgi:hypothetical protein
MDRDRELGRAARPPSSRPAWRWLWGLVFGAGALIAGAEGVFVSTPMHGAVEFTIAVAAVSGLLAWIHMNRTALLEREARQSAANR